MMAAGSFQATRTTGTVSVCEMACSIGATSLISDRPCCRSTHSASKPSRAITSAVKVWDTESQPSDTHCPACHFCLILFCRMVFFSPFAPTIPFEPQTTADASARILPVSRPLGVKVSIGADFRIVPLLQDDFAQLHS